MTDPESCLCVDCAMRRGLSDDVAIQYRPHLNCEAVAELAGVPHECTGYGEAPDADFELPEFTLRAGDWLVLADGRLMAYREDPAGCFDRVAT